VGRIRSIKPELPQSESIGRLSRDARLCFIMLWTLADDAGRLRGNSRMLASLLYPYDTDAGRLMDRWLGELADERCIQRYQVAGDSYIQIINWSVHQKIDRPSESKIPPFSLTSTDPREDSRGFAQPLDPTREASRGNMLEGKGREGKGMEGNGEEAIREAATNPPPDPNPNPAHFSLATELGVDCLAEWSRYRDWLKTNGRQHKDPAAGFRNWLRKAREFAPRKTAADGRAVVAQAIFGNRQGSKNDAIDGTAERVA
jgi:hypothetical protein